MRRPLRSQKDRSPALLVWSAAALLCAAVRPALAYIDPGTGGAVLGVLGPALAAIAVVFVATFHYTRLYIVAALRAVWRTKAWSLPVLAGLIGGVLYALLKG